MNLHNTCLYQFYFSIWKFTCRTVCPRWTSFFEDRICRRGECIQYSWISEPLDHEENFHQPASEEKTSPQSQPRHQQWSRWCRACWGRTLTPVCWVSTLSSWQSPDQRWNKHRKYVAELNAWLELKDMYLESTFSSY